MKRSDTPSVSREEIEEMIRLLKEEDSFVESHGVIPLLRRLQAQLSETRRAPESYLPFTVHGSLLGEWTPARCLHMGDAVQVEELCKLMNVLNGTTR